MFAFNTTAQFTGVCDTPVSVLQASTVQAIPSSVFTGVWVMLPFEGSQASVVQASPSLKFGPTVNVLS